MHVDHLRNNWLRAQPKFQPGVDLLPFQPDAERAKIDLPSHSLHAQSSVPFGATITSENRSAHLICREIYQRD